MARKSKVMIDAEGNQIDAKYLDPVILEREKVVEKVFKKIEKLEKQLEKTHQEISETIQKYLEHTAEKYGTQWKGNATLKNFREDKIVEVQISRRVEFDERLQIAGEKINQWIQKNMEKITDEKTRKSFQKVADIARRALKIDRKGKVDYQKIIQLKQFKFDDAEWQEAMKLIDEAMRIVSTKIYHRFKKRDENGRYVTVRTSYSDF